ncbi:MAG: ribosome biogenesis GTPase Der [Lentisphaerae bacterium]|nr:ribosome biogenesis GTPase Der [Lentisphaerota bacterium]
MQADCSVWEKSPRNAGYNAGAAPRRVVAIVGRPNVGKSALFNRLVARRIAIVHAESGVTRDRLVEEVVWGEERFELEDTGGVRNPDGAAARDRIEAGVRAQVDAALSDAAVAVLVTDVTAGVTPLDLEVAGLLRAGGRAAVVAANKADHAARDAGADAFAELGLPVFPVSALHNRGIEELVTAVLARLPDVPNPTLAEPLKVAVVGRPNVGKSSYINRLLRSERLLVSAEPGTTRDSVSVPFAIGGGAQARHYVLIDTAGLRHARNVKSAVERYGAMRAERSIDAADVVVLMLDATRGASAQDKRIAARIVERGKGCAILVNKWDLAAGLTEREYRAAVLEAIPFLRHCPVVFASAKDGYNIRRTIDALDRVASQVQADLPTGVLNRAVAEACGRAAPPAFQGRSLRVFYAVQVGRKPVTVRLFVNDPRCARPAYSDYLVRRLRERFGLEGAPVRLEYRRRHAEPRPDARARRSPARRRKPFPCVTTAPRRAKRRCGSVRPAARQSGRTTPPCLSSTTAG